jgi:hypothetical protein
MNPLDQALIAARKSTSAMPEFYRQLGEGELFLLIPNSGDMDLGDCMQLKNGMPVPFLMLQDEEGSLVPIFSSEERAQEGLARGKVPPNTCMIVSMQATQALEALGKCGLRTILNKSCTTPEFILPADLMRDIASGEVFRPLLRDDKAPAEERALNLIDPADYPTDIVQPVFEVLRKHRQFRAAWIFLDGPAAAEGRRLYQLLFLMDPRDAEVHHEVNMVLAALRSELNVEIDHGMVDETDPVYIADMFRQATPFYLAADFGGGK